MKSVNANWISTVGRVAVSVIVIIGFFWALAEVIDAKTVGGPQREILLIMLGALTTKFGDVVIYWIGSSAGSSDKDATQAANTSQLIEAVSTSSPGGGTGAGTGQPWWVKLTEGEKSAIQAAAQQDAKVKDFMDKSAAGTATAEELAYVVGLGLLTQDRAAALSA